MQMGQHGGPGGAAASSAPTARDLAAMNSASGAAGGAASAFTVDEALLSLSAAEGSLDEWDPEHEQDLR